MLQTLGKHDQTTMHNAENVMEQVLCGGGDGAIQRIIASYAAEPYIPISDSCRDSTLDWYTERFQSFVNAVHFLKKGDKKAAHLALREWCDTSLRLSLVESAEPKLISPYEKLQRNIHCYGIDIPCDELAKRCLDYLEQAPSSR